MNKLYLFLALILICSKAIGQTHCSEVLRTTTPTINLWDWRGEMWDIYYKNAIGQDIHTTRLSPFFDTQNQNCYTLAAADDSPNEKDYRPEDGWELVAKDLGTPAYHTTKPFILFYNKYTGKLRVFFFIIQLFSESGTNDLNKGGTVKISFVNKDPTTFQSNLLTSYATPLLPLDKFVPNANLAVPNRFQSSVPYWLYGEFPVIYDPCTCTNGYKSAIFLEANLLNQANVEITINSQPYQKPIENGQVSNSNFFTNFTTFGTKVEGGIKAFGSAVEGINGLITTIDKQTNSTIKNFLDTEFKGFGNLVGEAGNWLSLIPKAGVAVKSVLSLIDFFSSGGKKEKTNQGPAPVMIMNNFKAKGTISNNFPKNSATILVPGSDQTGISLSLVPIYNNTLGVMNLLNTPSIKQYKVGGQYLVHQLINPQTIKFVINPVLGVDISRSEIKAALVLEGFPYPLNYDQYLNANLQVDAEQKDSLGRVTPIYRTSYYPINCLINSLAKVDYINLANYPSIASGKVYLKVIARLKRTGTTSDAEDIIFMAKYPTTLSIESKSISSFNLSSPEDMLEDIKLPSFVPANSSNPILALNTITLQYAGTGQVFNYPHVGSQLTLRASGVIVNQGVKLNPGVLLQAVNYYPSNCSNAFIQANSADLSSFCNDVNTYKKTIRTNPPVGREEEGQAQEKEEILTTQLLQAHPNPAASLTTIAYILAELSSVELYVSNVLGERVAVLVKSARTEAGQYEVAFDTSHLPAGVYFYTLQTATSRETKRLVVSK